MKKITILLSIILLVHLSDLSAQRKSTRTSDPIKVLVKASGASEQDCKNALEQADGNIDIAQLLIKFPNASVKECRMTLKSARGNIDKAKAELGNKYKIDNRDSKKNKKDKISTKSEKSNFGQRTRRKNKLTFL